jgi:hypothetical protein
MGGACGMYRGQERCIQGFGGGGAPDGKRPLGRPRHRWEDNINYPFTALWQMTVFHETINIFSCLFLQQFRIFISDKVMYTAE